MQSWFLPQSIDFTYAYMKISMWIFHVAVLFVVILQKALFLLIQLENDIVNAGEANDLTSFSPFSTSRTVFHWHTPQSAFSQYNFLLERLKINFILR